AGFETTPAEEIFEVEGSEEEQNQVVEEKTGKPVEKANKQVLKESVFITWPEAHNGHKALIMGLTAIRKFGVEAYIRKDATGDFNDRDGGYYIPADKVPELRKMLQDIGCPVLERAYGNGKGRESEAPVS